MHRAIILLVESRFLPSVLALSISFGSMSLTNGQDVSTSTDSLVKEASSVAAKNWSLAFPGETPVMQMTANFLLVGKPGNRELEALGKRAEDMLKKSSRQLGISQLNLQRRLTVYVIPSRYDFGEFTQMVEKRSIAGAAAPYWRPDGETGYAVLGPLRQTKSKQLTLVGDAQLARLVSALLLNRWSAPVWYAEGIGQIALEQTNRRDKQVAAWKTRARQAVRRVKSAKSFFEGKLPADEADAVTWAFAKYLFQDQRRAHRLFAALHAGEGFEEAFTSAYGKSAEVICDAWIERHRVRRKK